MPDYRYRALNMHGRIQKGLLAADTPRDLQLRLMQAGMTLIESRLHTTSDWRSNLRRGSPRDLAQFCHHVAKLEGASVRLINILQDVTASLQPSRLRTQLTEVTEAVQAGSSLSTALQQRQQHFPPPMPALVAAGEASGDLAASFRQLGMHYDWQAKLRARLTRVLAYPLFALCAMTAVILFLLVFVIPETSQFLKDMNVTLPAHSLLLMAIAAFVSAYGGMVAFGFALLLVAAITAYKRSEIVARWLDGALLKMPLVGSLLGKVDLARFTKILAMLLESGIDLPPALATAAGAVRNRIYREGLAIVRAQVDSGNSLSFAVQLSGIFPALAYRMILAGEESGTLPASIRHVATYYEDDVNNSAEALVTAIGPVITLITGGMLIWLILAVFMPIYDVLPQLM